jgi:cell wall-associated NlpC family hydrolase
LAPAHPAAAAPAASVVAERQAALAALATGVDPAGVGMAERRRIAVAVAVAAEVEAAPVVAVWEAAAPAQVTAAVTAVAQIGVRYRRRGGHPSEGFDCSGFTSWAWASAGVSLGRSSGDQLGTAGHRRAEAQLADLVGYPGHVMLYLGGDAVIHSPYTGRSVEVIPLRRHVDHFVTPAFEPAPARNPSVMARVRAF